jgi:hypothetical protein
MAIVGDVCGNREIQPILPDRHAASLAGQEKNRRVLEMAEEEKLRRKEWQNMSDKLRIQSTQNTRADHRPI